MRTPAAPQVDIPRVPFVALSSLWLVLSGTLCNLRCTHCLNASGPDEPWLPPLDTAVARRAIAEAETLGVREIYFTGGEPFLHRDIVPLLEASLAVAATTVLTNGTVMTDALADTLAALARASRYSLEIRVSLDAPDAGANDRVRGAGTWRRAVRAIRVLDARGLLPIVTATDVTGAPDVYERFRALLAGLGVAKPRVKILPVFPVGRAAGRPPACRCPSASSRGSIERHCSAPTPARWPPVVSMRARSWPACPARACRTAT